MKKTSRSVHKLLIISFIAFVIVGLAILVFGWYYILNLSEGANKITTEVTNIEKESNALSGLSLRYAHVSDQKDLALQAIPKTKDVSVFLATVEGLASKNSVYIKGNLIGESQVTGSKKILDPQLSQTTSNDKDGYYQLKIKYTFDGSYSNILSLVQDISSLRRVNSIESVSMNTDIPDVAPGVDKVTAEVAVNIFVKK